MKRVAELELSWICFWDSFWCSSWWVQLWVTLSMSLTAKKMHRPRELDLTPARACVRAHGHFQWDMDMAYDQALLSLIFFVFNAL